MPDFTADEDIQGSNMTPEEETKPEVKVEEESIEIRQEVKAEVKMEEDVGPAGDGEQDSQETEQQPEQVEGDRGGNFSCQSIKGSQRVGSMYKERLIVEVEQHTIIYDTSHPFYKDIARKEKAWQLISGVLGVDADTCKTRWKALRDTFVRNRKKPLPSGSAGGTQREWKYSEIMSFLLPHIQPRSSKSNLSLVQEEEERSATPQSLSGSEDRSSTPGISLPPSSTSSSTTSTSQSSRDRASKPAVAAQLPRKSRRGQRQDTDIGERLMSLLEQPVPKPHMPDGELDETYHFALSIVPMLHRLNKDRRQRAKIEILTVLHNLESSQTQQQPPSIPPPAPGQSSHPPQFQPLPTPRTPLPSPHSKRLQPFSASSPPTTNGVVHTNAPEDWEDLNAMGQIYSDT